MVVGNYVGNFKIGVVHLTHRNSYYSCKTCAVHLVTKVVKNSVVFEKISVAAANRDFVRKSPNYDRGVVIVLSNKLGHLADGVSATGGHVLRDVRNFRPNNHTVLVAEIVEVLVVLIVSKTNGGTTYLVDIFHILLVVLGKKCVTKTESVLVTGYTAKRIFLTVKDKATVGIDLVGTATESCANVVDNLLAFNDFSLTAVEIGINTSVPEMHVLDFKVNNLVGSNYSLKLFFILVIKGVGDLLTFLKLGSVNLYLNFRLFALNGGSNLDTGCAEVIEVEVGFSNGNDVYVTVKTAVEGEVCHLGINGLVGSIVNNDSKGVVTAYKIVGKINSPGGVTAIVVAKVLAI
jgi:hypothetical protein